MAKNKIMLVQDNNITVAITQNEKGEQMISTNVALHLPYREFDKEPDQLEKKVLGYLPKSSKNYLTAKEISKHSGINERTVWGSVGTLRRKCVPVVSLRRRPKGYAIADNEKDVDECIATLTHQFREIIYSIVGLARAKDNIKHN